VFVDTDIEEGGAAFVRLDVDGASDTPTCADILSLVAWWISKVDPAKELK
jgi:hypothetical protein